MMLTGRGDSVAQRAYRIDGSIHPQLLRRVFWRVERARWRGKPWGRSRTRGRQGNGREDDWVGLTLEEREQAR